MSELHIISIIWVCKKEIKDYWISLPTEVGKFALFLIQELEMELDESHRMLNFSWNDRKNNLLNCNSKSHSRDNRIQLH